MSGQTKQQGEKIEAAILADLLDHGITVLQPFGEHHRYDFVIEINDSFYKLQAKKARVENGCLTFSTRSSQPRRGGNTKADYEGDIDFFVTSKNLGSTTYLIPIEEAAANEMSLRITSPKNNQTKGINWAREYEMSGRIASLEGT